MTLPFSNILVAQESSPLACVTHTQVSQSDACAYEQQGCMERYKKRSPASLTYHPQTTQSSISIRISSRPESHFHHLANLLYNLRPRYNPLARILQIRFSLEARSSPSRKSRPRIAIESASQSCQTESWGQSRHQKCTTSTKSAKSWRRIPTLIQPSTTTRRLGNVEVLVDGVRGGEINDDGSRGRILKSAKKRVKLARNLVQVGAAYRGRRRSVREVADFGGVKEDAGEPEEEKRLANMFAQYSSQFRFLSA
jgi:hypothetical protein